MYVSCKILENLFIISTYNIINNFLLLLLLPLELLLWFSLLDLFWVLGFSLKGEVPEVVSGTDSRDLLIRSYGSDVGKIVGRDDDVTRTVPARIGVLVLI